MNFLKCVMAFGVLWLMSFAAQAAIITTDYHNIGGITWVVDLTLVGDGEPTNIKGFTTYFAHDSFASLTLVSSPASWDTLVIQPDVGLLSDGFLDSFVLDGSGLFMGEIQSGFSVQFSYLGIGVPKELAFDIVDFDYQIVFQGVTQSKPIVTVVSEPRTLALMLVGFLLIFGRFRYAIFFANFSSVWKK